MNKASTTFKTSRHAAAALALALLALALLAIAPEAASAGGPRTAVFGFELDDTSIQGGGAADQARLRRLDAQLREALTRSGRYTLVDTASLASQEASQTLHSCVACAAALARQVDATVEVNGWVQKVSDLILNINLVVRDVASGRMLAAGSADIRGDTDESWTRGLAWLLRHRILVDAS
jgi:hypothetical protein